MFNPYFSGFLFLSSFMILIDVSTIIKTVRLSFKNISILRDVTPKTAKLAGISFSCVITVAKQLKKVFMG